MSAGIFHLDGKLPNMALMRLSAHKKAQGVKVHFFRADNPKFDFALLPEFDEVYGSTIFERTKEHAEKLLWRFPQAQIGGTGWDITKTLDPEIESSPLDYSLYPEFQHSIGFSQRGCRLRCSFCVVPKKEGAIRDNLTINEIWRGEGHPKNILLLDNDFFGQPNWREKSREILDGKFKVCFSQGINARLINDESAETLAALNYRDDSFVQRRIYTAWDNRKDEERLFTALEKMCKHGVRPSHIMVYILIGYWPGETHEDRDYRRKRLREFGALPYPMPFVRSKELVGFQRWVIGGYDRRGITWADWLDASYRPEKLGNKPEYQTARRLEALTKDTVMSEFK